MDAAAEKVGREVCLIAVSKTFGIDSIREAYDAGHRHFGESRLQEAIPKIEALPEDIVWHFVGPLQSNKAKRIASLFSIIHSFENEGQIREATKGGRSVQGLLEVNIGEEPQKKGLKPDLNVLNVAKSWLKESGIVFAGLMTIGPDLDPESMRSHFQRMASLNRKLGGTWLSMGMSQDFEVAIEEGATHVRVGSAIFGDR